VKNPILDIVDPFVSPNQFSRAPAGTRHVAFKLLFENVSERNWIIGSFDLRLTDADEFQSAPAIVVFTEPTLTGAPPLSGGGKFEGWVAFEPQIRRLPILTAAGPLGSLSTLGFAVRLSETFPLHANGVGVGRQTATIEADLPTPSARSVRLFVATSECEPILEDPLGRRQPQAPPEGPPAEVMSNRWT
jgi:hypothetical protein